MIVSFLSGKGGVGKTSIVANLGKVLASKGRTTLIVDMDFFTRGLTFFVTRGLRFTPGGERKTVIDGIGVLELLEQDQEVSMQSSQTLLTKLSENLYFLPATKYATKYVAEEQVNSLLVEKMRELRLLLETTKFEYILIDARSGIGTESIVPALISDKYCIVTEEDNTSLRISKMLLETIDMEAESRFIKKPEFGGIIINQSVSATPPDKLIDLIELVMFEKRCLSFITMQRNVRRAFAKDLLVVEQFPSTVFAREMQNLAEYLVEGRVRNPLTGFKANRRGTIVPIVAIGSTAIIASSFVLFLEGAGIREAVFMFIIAFMMVALGLLAARNI